MESKEITASLCKLVFKGFYLLAIFPCLFSILWLARLDYLTESILCEQNP